MAPGQVLIGIAIEFVLTLGIVWTASYFTKKKGNKRIDFLMDQIRQLRGVVDGWVDDKVVGKADGASLQVDTLGGRVADLSRDVAALSHNLTKVDQHHARQTNELRDHLAVEVKKVTDCLKTQSDPSPSNTPPQDENTWTPNRRTIGEIVNRKFVDKINQALAAHNT